MKKFLIGIVLTIIGGILLNLRTAGMNDQSQILYWLFLAVLVVGVFFFIAGIFGFIKKVEKIK